MPDFAVNLSMLFTEHPLKERFAAAAQAGFKKVEIQFPYELSIADIKAQLDQHNLELILINAPAGNWAAGERGIACHPDRIDEQQQGVTQAISYATALNCRKINLLAGITPQNSENAQVKSTFIRNLYSTAAACDAKGITLVSEAINTQDIPGFYLNTSDQAWQLFAEVGHANLKLQFDIYHMQIMQGNLIKTLQENIDRIGHIQFADVPGRHEPGTGEINFTNVFNAIDATSYAGSVSLEYIPLTSTLTGLSWLNQSK